jgi:poly-gamma-glutamate synthesis protein (capsule biosynthesis protein)
MGKKITVLAAGEMILGMEDGDPFSPFDAVKDMFKEADLVFGHLEHMHTERPMLQGKYMAPPPPARNIEGLEYAHFDAVTLAGNPTFMQGAPGVEDTIKWLDDHGIGHVGAGMNIDEARKPLITERGGVKFGFIAVNCLGGTAAAGLNKAGAAYVDVLTYYPPPMFPGATPAALTFLEPWSLKALKEDIRALRPQCDVLIVVLHKGMSLDNEAVLADYEYELPRHCINEGADLIVSNHAHLLKAMEFYKGVPIYHCLGNLVTIFPYQVHSMFKEEPETTLNRSKLRPRSGRSRSWLDLDTPNFPFHPAGRQSMIGKIVVDADTKKIEQVGFHPVYIDRDGHPIPVGKSELGQKVFDYMEKITAGARCNAKYKWDGDEIIAYGDGEPL